MRNDHIQELRDWLNQNKGSWPRIAGESGVTVWWIYKFMSKHPPSPRYENVSRLLDYKRQDCAA